MDATTSTGRDRAAFAAIKGYVYQFDRTLMSFLNAAPGDIVTVEGIEDVDVAGDQGTYSEQCKYHPSQTFSLSGIRPAVLAMLVAFCAGQERDYRLFLHCADGGRERAPSALTREELKKCMTVTRRDGRGTEHLDAPFSEEDIERFLAHFELIVGEEYDQQKIQVHSGLRDQLAASAEDVADLYYGNALTAVINLAVLRRVEDRQMTRKDFFTALDTKRLIYGRWHREEVRRAGYVGGVVRALKQRRYLRVECHQLLAVAIGSIDDVDVTVQLVEVLARRGFGPGKLSTAQPWTFLVDADAELHRALKARLLGKGIFYNDGYEALAFTPAAFDRKPFFQRNPSGSILSASYDVRIASVASYRAHLDAMLPPDVALFAGVAPMAVYTGRTPPRHEDMGDVPLDVLVEILERSLP